MSLFTGLTTKHKLAGIFALSSYLVLGDKIKTLAEENGHVNKDAKWFMGHGAADPLVKYDWGVKTAEVLKKELGVKDLDFQTYYGLAHSADPLELDHVEGFIRKCLSAVGDECGQGSKKGEL
jgi:predicted esterase